MKFVVCIKQVPDTTEVEVNKETGTIIREGVPSILNPFDEFAMNVALKVREKVEATIVALSMGPPQAEQALKKCLAIGADEAILLTDRAFAGSDTWVTSLVLARAVRKIGDADIIFCGQQAIDGDTAQVGPEMAQHLGLPQVTYMEEVEEVQKSRVVCRKETDDGYIRVRCKLPAVLACLATSDFEPRIPNIRDIFRAKKKPLHQWSVGDIGGGVEEYGLEGSATQVIKSYAPSERGECVMVDEPPEAAVKKILEYLSDQGVIG